MYVIGIVICGSANFVMASCSQILMASLDTHVAGIMTILRGILFSKDCGLFPCVLETDRAAAVNRVLNVNFLRLMS